MMRENFHLTAVEEKPKRGFFYLLAVRGGGFGVSPRKFLKNGCKWCILSPFSPSSCRFPPKKLCVIFAFKAPISIMRDIFFLSHGGGGGGGSSRFFFLKNGYKWYILSPFIADCLLVFFFYLKFHFCHVSPVVQGMWCHIMWEFTGDYMGGVGFFSCVGRIQGATQPPSKYFEKLMQYALRDDFSRLKFCILSKGIFWGAIKGRRILMIRELLSCNFWGISTILKAQGTSREIILR